MTVFQGHCDIVITILHLPTLPQVDSWAPKKRVATDILVQVFGDCATVDAMMPFKMGTPHWGCCL